MFVDGIVAQSPARQVGVARDQSWTAIHLGSTLRKRFGWSPGHPAHVAAAVHARRLGLSWTLLGRGPRRGAAVDRRHRGRCGVPGGMCGRPGGGRGWPRLARDPRGRLSGLDHDEVAAAARTVLAPVPVRCLDAAPRTHVVHRAAASSRPESCRNPCLPVPSAPACCSRSTRSCRRAHTNRRFPPARGTAGHASSVRWNGK
ncbi:Uncharacterised protein [Mycobacteroides abscessus subsp. abscessus]|nr:Uncharacterised protein [Mycobacteroides abscessus subsp. abscessus]